MSRQTDDICKTKRPKKVMDVTKAHKECHSRSKVIPGALGMAALFGCVSLNKLLIPLKDNTLHRQQNHLTHQ